MKIEFILIEIIFVLFISGCNNKTSNDNIEKSTTKIVFESKSIDNTIEDISSTDILQSQDVSSTTEYMLGEKNATNALVIATAYQKIIDEYKNAVNLGGIHILENDFPNINFVAVMHSAYESRDNRGKFYANDSEFYEDIDIVYTTYDIDKNGIDELLIFYSRWIENNICDIYSFDGKSAFKLFDDDTLGERTTLTIYEDGLMYIYGSGGAAYGTAEFYRLNNNGYTLDLIKKYKYNSYDYQATPYYNENEFLSIEEFEKNFSNLVEVTNYNVYSLNTPVVTKQ